MTEIRIVDADCHILEPPDIWANHLGAKWQDKAPQLVKDHEGGDFEFRSGELAMSASVDPVQWVRGSTAKTKLRAERRLSVERKHHGTGGFSPFSVMSALQILRVCSSATTSCPTGRPASGAASRLRRRWTITPITSSSAAAPIAAPPLP